MIAIFFSSLLFILLLRSSLDAQEQASELADSLVRDRDDLFQDIDSTDRARIAATLASTSLQLDRDLPFRPVSMPRSILTLEDPSTLIRFDRSDGLYLGLGSDRPAPLLDDLPLRGHATLGYAFGSHYWQTMAGLIYSLVAGPSPLDVAVEGHIRTDTRDAWKIGATENTLVTLAYGNDARDYHRRSGISIALAKQIGEGVTTTLTYRWDDYRNAQRTITQPLFRWSRLYRPVPSIREGPMSTLATSVLLDRTTGFSRLDVRGVAEAEVEIGLGESSFAGYLIELRLDMPLIGTLFSIASRGRIGAASGDAPRQRWFTLGGIGSLPGYPQNAYEGNRMLLLQLDLICVPLDDLQLIVSNHAGWISDAGTAWNPLPRLNDVTAVKYSPGIYLATSTGAIRAGLSWRTDRAAAPTVMIRLASTF